MIEVRKLDEERWGEYRDLRLGALKSDAIAFASSYEEVSFTWTPNNSGDYYAIVKTNVVDDQCSASEESSSEKKFNVYSSSSLSNGQCYTLLNNLYAEPAMPTVDRSHWAESFVAEFVSAQSYVLGHFIDNPELRNRAFAQLWEKVPIQAFDLAKTMDDAPNVYRAAERLVETGKGLQRVWFTAIRYFRAPELLERMVANNHLDPQNLDSSHFWYSALSLGDKSFVCELFDLPQR